MSGRVLAVLFLVVVFVVSNARSAHSWQAITHYYLGVESKADPDGWFQNIPDSWPSHRGLFRWFEITEWFAWSHGVQRTGRTSTVPNVPAYPNDNRSTGQDMYQLYKNDKTALPLEYETALGFLTHVAQDRAVHYRYFRGGSRAAWVEEHEKKEEWADCAIYQFRMGGTWPPNLPIIRNRGNAELISKAEAVFIASGLSTDRGRQVTLPKQESPSEIAKRLSETEQSIFSYLHEFDERTCRDLGPFVLNYDWTLDELEEYYLKSLDATRKVLANFPR